METSTAITPPINNKKSDKISRFLKKLLDSKFKLENEVYLKTIINHLLEETNDSNIGKLDKRLASKEYSEEFCEWLITVANLWDNQNVTPSNMILSFTLNLASLLSKYEEIFVQLNCQNVYEKLVGVMQKNANSDINVILGLVVLFYSFLEHKCGLQWVLATTYWTNVVKVGRKTQNDHIRQKAYDFVAKLLQKTIYFNRNFCHSIITVLLKPLQDAYKKCLPGAALAESNYINNPKVVESLKPTLVFVSGVCEAISKSTNDSVLDVFFELKTLHITSKLIDLSKVEDLSFELLKINCILVFWKMTKTNIFGKDRLQLSVNMQVDFVKVVKDEINKGHDRSLIKLSHYSHMLYVSMSGTVPDCVRGDRRLEFHNQLILFQLMPILIFVGHSSRLALEDTLNDVYQRDFIHKLINMSSFRMIELAFSWEKTLLASPNLMEHLTLVLVYIMNSKKALNKERAAILFQPLAYYLQKYVKSIEGQRNVAISPSYSLFLNTLIDAIIDLVQSFDLTWRDSIVTISVMSIACDFLQFTHWSDQLNISGLMLLNLAISKYMSPAMVLLMDNSNDTLVSLTGSILYSKCQNRNWEIRDAALRNVHTLSLNANSMFPSYTNILLEAKLAELVVHLTLEDKEGSVRATAFKCLQEMIQIQEIWNMFMQMDHFLDNIFVVLENDTEAMVRKEAAELVLKIHKEQEFPVELLPRIYDIMTHVATTDPFWEVKYSALSFWFLVLETHLNKQGMLDRKFPEVTFSGELRKIVTLNDAEVRRRLIKVLNQLSRIGCLHVLKCVCLDTDRQIFKRAAQATGLLVELFKSYKVPCENVDLNEPDGSQRKDQFIPLSPASSITMTSSECDFESSETIEPVSPFTNGGRTSLNLDTLTDDSFNPFSFFPLSSGSIQTTSSCNTTTVENDKGVSWGEGDLSSSNLYSASRNYDVDMLSATRSDGIEKSTKLDEFDQMHVKKIMEDLLSSGGALSLNQMYNPCNQVQSNRTKVKNSIYLAPSEYLKFIYEFKYNTTEETQQLNNIDQFNSILDHILDCC